MTRWMKVLALSGLVLATTTGCDEGTTGPEAMDAEALRAEVALVTADGVLQDLSLIQSPGLFGLGFGGAGALGAPGQGQGGPCHAMGGGAFQCPAMVRDGFTVERTVTFHDVNGGVMDGFERGVTDKVHLVMDASGTIERAFWSAAIVRHRDMTIEGLTTDLHTANGTKTEEVHRSRNPADGSSRSFDMTGSSTIENVVHAVPRSENPYPLSGTITRQVHVVVKEDGEIIGERDVTVVITFDGTQFATMTVDGETFRIDLAARQVNGRRGKNG